MTTPGLANKTFILNLAYATNGEIVQSPATATLVDAVLAAPVEPTISVANTSLTVGSTATDVPFTISLSAATTATVTVIYGESDGTATAASGATGHLRHFGVQPRSTLEGCRRARCGHDCLQPGQRDLLLRRGRRDHPVPVPVNATFGQYQATATLTKATSSPSCQ